MIGEKLRLSKHPSLIPKQIPEQNILALIEKAKESIKDLQIPVKSLSLVDIDKLSETMKTAQTCIHDTVSSLNEYLNIQIQRTNLNAQDVQETHKTLEQTILKIDNLTTVLTEIHMFLQKLFTNAEKEREVLDLLKKELSP
jgi:DNA repair ATPase RecN